MINSPFFLSWALAKRPSERYPVGEVDEGAAAEEELEAELLDWWSKHSMLKLFFNTAIEDGDDDDDNEEWEDKRSSWTPKSLNRPPETCRLRELQVLELWPIFPQCEHFLPILFPVHWKGKKKKKLFPLSFSTPTGLIKLTKGEERWREKERKIGNSTNWSTNDLTCLGLYNLQAIRYMWWTYISINLCIRVNIEQQMNDLEEIVVRYT